MTDYPKLKNWRIIAGCLVGVCENHPLLKPGWIITSNVKEMSPDESYAITQNRRYDLGPKLSDFEDLPDEAKQLILNVILKNANRLNLEDLQKFAELTDNLSKAPKRRLH